MPRADNSPKLLSAGNEGGFKVVELAVVGAGAAIGGLALGAFIGAWLMSNKLRRRFEDVREEIVSLRRAAESKLANDDPDLETLLGNLHKALEQTHGAIEALENQGKVIREKTDCGREIILSSRRITGMIDDLGDDADSATWTQKRLDGEPPQGDGKRTAPQLA